MILMYHKVDVEAPTMWWVDVESFYRQMCSLQALQVVLLDDYDPRDERQVVITFDGVYRNVLTYAAPIMARFGYPFELFVSSDWIGLKNTFDRVEPSAEFADAEDLRQLVKMGGRLQWHTRSHPMMRQARNDADWSTVDPELCVPDEVKALDRHGFGWFAYPYGQFSEDVCEEVRHRFRGAVSCDQGNDHDMHQLNRITATNARLPFEKSVDLVVVSHNYGEFLAEAVESALAQTYPANRILIVDDASDDSTQQIGERYASLYPERVAYHRNPERLGIVETFNRAVALSGSDLVCFLGADNRLASNYLEMCVRTILKENADVAYTDFRLFGANAAVEYYRHEAGRRGRIIDEHFYEIVFPEFSKARLSEGNFIHGSAMYTRRAFDAVGGYQDAGPGRPEDANLFRRMIAKGFAVAKAPETWLEYRQHSTAQANIVSRMQGDLEFYRIYAKRLEYKVRALEAAFGVLSPAIRLLSFAEKAFFEMMVKLARAWRRFRR